MRQQDQALDRYQDDWAARVEQNGKVSGVYTDYHYYGTGDIGGEPDEESVKRLEAIVTKSSASLPPYGLFIPDEPHPEWPAVNVGEGPVKVVSANGRSDVSRYHAFRNGRVAALYRRNGVDKPFGWVADFAGIPKTLAPQRGVAGRCSRESVPRG